MEHTTTGLPVDTRSGAERAFDTATRRGYVQEAELLRLALPEGNGYDRRGVWDDLRRGPIADGTLVMLWTRQGMPYYLTPCHALRLTAAGTVSWVKDGDEEVPVVNGPLDFELVA